MTQNDQLWRISFDDAKGNCFLFRRFDQSESRVVVRTTYEDLQCVRCLKIDEIAAMTRGIDGDVRFNTAREMFLTLDFQLVLHDRIKAIIEDAASDEITTLPIPSLPQLQIATPNNWLKPDHRSDAFNIVSTCPGCLRPTEAIWGSGIPERPRMGNIAAYAMESRLGILPVWIVSDRLATRLRTEKPKIEGVNLRKLPTS